METMTTKKDFLHWFLKNHKTKSKEGLWILNYVLSNERVLKRVKFVEHASGTACGLMVSSVDSPYAPIVFHKGDKASTIPENAFAEIRSSEGPIYIEIQFKHRLKNSLFVTALEDVKSLSDNEEVKLTNQELRQVDRIIEKSIHEGAVRHLQEQIDQALISGDRESFLALSAQYIEVVNH